MHSRQRCLLVRLFVGLIVAGVPSAQASSHRDAPLIKQDPQADNTDVYAFVSAEGLNVVVNVRPFSEPGDGPIYARFADEAQYTIHLANPTTGETVLRYDFEFSDVNPKGPPGLKSPGTILSYGRGVLPDLGPVSTLDDPRRNYTQSYTVKRNGNLVGSGITGPPNVGVKTTPNYNDQNPASPTFGKAVSGATSFAELDEYARQAIIDLANDEKAFAGPRDDGFYADISGMFDLLDGRLLDNDGDPNDGLGQDGGGPDGFKGYNVLTFALQTPVSTLDSVPGFPLIGIYASVSRKRIRLLRTNDDPLNAGGFVQVSRQGNPLFNEAFVALKDKDKYNRTSPTGDAANFRMYAEDPELARLVNVVFGVSIPETGRNDIFSIYIPDVLRVDTSTGPVPLTGQPGFNRLSGFGGDTTNGLPSGWPNGRRLGDDVLDIALTALAGGTVPGGLLGDNVNANDQAFHQVFPFAATPHSGAKNDTSGGRAVSLEFQTGTIPATSVVCLDKVIPATDGCIFSGPECTLFGLPLTSIPHLHRNISITGQAGTFPDPNGGGCGHGKIILNAPGCGPDIIPNCP